MINRKNPRNNSSKSRKNTENVGRNYLWSKYVKKTFNGNLGELEKDKNSMINCEKNKEGIPVEI